MAGRGICYYFHAVEAVVNVRIPRDPELFTDLAGDLCVVTLNNSITKNSFVLSFDLLDNNRQLKFNSSMDTLLAPRAEPSILSVVVAASHVHFWPNQNNLLVQAVDAAVV